jgi:hypothetical protein
LSLAQIRFYLRLSAANTFFLKIQSGVAASLCHRTPKLPPSMKNEKWKMRNGKWFLISSPTCITATAP